MKHDARARALLDRLDRLPEPQRDALVALIEETLDKLETSPSHMQPDVRAAFEAAAREHAATLAYLKDR